MLVPKFSSKWAQTTKERFPEKSDRGKRSDGVSRAGAWYGGVGVGVGRRVERQTAVGKVGFGRLGRLELLSSMAGVVRSTETCLEVDCCLDGNGVGS